ncbi:hypothetical protein MK280_00585 [Myxococcota bacterium]|nr:hypothetical protein [Myxococcota bacterium]
MRARASRRAAAFGLLSIGLLGLSGSVLAYLPSPERIYRAMAAANKADGRDGAIQMKLQLQIGDRPAVATAELISHPSGLARIELRGAGGLLERHLLQGDTLTVSRNGQVVENPRTFLPPLFLLQARTGPLVESILESLSVDVESWGLTPCGEADCLLIGDPARAIARPEPPPLKGLDAWAARRAERGTLDSSKLEANRKEDASTEEVLEGDPPASSARVWVERGRYEVRGYADGHGVEIRLGPLAQFDKLQVPAWIQIEEKDRAPARLEVLAAERVNAPGAAFTQEWLLAPVPGPPGQSP